MSNYIAVLDYLLDHGSMTVNDAKEKLDMMPGRFRESISSLKEVIQIKSDTVPFDGHRVMKRHSLVRDAGSCFVV